MCLAVVVEFLELVLGRLRGFACVRRRQDYIVHAARLAAVAVYGGKHRLRRLQSAGERLAEFLAQVGGLLLAHEAFVEPVVAQHGVEARAVETAGYGVFEQGSVYERTWRAARRTWRARGCASSDRARPP
ncbi:MAG: hypothetical protein U1E30_05120 [Rhodoblastus sp.]